MESLNISIRQSCLKKLYININQITMVLFWKSFNDLIIFFVVVVSNLGVLEYHNDPNQHVVFTIEICPLVCTVLGFLNFKMYKCWLWVTFLDLSFWCITIDIIKLNVFICIIFGGDFVP